MSYRSWRPAEPPPHPESPRRSVGCADGLGIGAAWEIVEFAYDQFSEGNLILGKFDTMMDLLCDLGGAVAAAVLLAVRGGQANGRSTD